MHGKKGTVGKTEDEIIAEKFPNIVLSDEIIWHKSNQWEDFWESVTCS